jgi:hypothetical protein
MHRAEFTAYRRAFSNLLECAAGNAQEYVCIDGWISDASVLFTDSKDVSYARTLVAYYLNNYLRHPTERIRKFCTG